ncbi:hypothetical protein L1987_84309 [Smallanthus sonchifolius]|uniref:Uncharacterized protein n=1 Tax=Smallanthus sonchifolius TaxID=185202 RepID=A0ACB8YFW1_9ASTR|nr:hypothetical protein L1987_84309 [Smallanthus sonchifolius]
MHEASKTHHHQLQLHLLIINLNNMKSFTNPKFSPGRTEDFPAPLIMFPRSKSNRRSRSRANPMFVRKINSGNEAIPEPSSPKVTCIGQVRVKRLNNKQTTTTAVRRCKWLRRLNPRQLRRVWREKISIFRCDCFGKSEKLQEPDANRITREMRGVIGKINGELVSESPPRNVFLLTRSRSAPYRYSSAGKRILEVEDDESSKTVTEESEEDEGSVNGVEGFKSEPLNLSRCKSEPARRGDKLFMSFSFSSF